MSPQDVACFVQQLDFLRPNYLSWRNDKAGELARSRGMSPAEAMKGILTAMATEMADVTPSEAGDAIDAIQAGTLALFDSEKKPAWGEVAAKVRAWAIDQRHAKKAQRIAVARDPREAPRYECLNCRDTGVVNVFNVFFVREFRSFFEETYNGRCPKDHTFRTTCQRFATQHHEKHVTLPLTHVGICDCNGDQSHICRAQLADWKAGRLKAGRYPRGGTFEWKPEKCPICPNGTDQDMFAALADWYASYPELF